MSAQSKESPPESPPVEQFYPLRGDCTCPELEDLWAALQEVDRCALEATEYAEPYVQEGMPRNSLLKKPLDRRIEGWANALSAYGEAMMDLTLDGGLSGREKETGEFIPLIDAVTEGRDDDISGVYCSGCHTEIPRPRYRDWDIVPS